MNFSKLVLSKKHVGLALLMSSMFGVSSQASAYCDSQGNSVNYEWIGGVGINAYTNFSGENGGYADFSDESIEMHVGANPIELVPGFRSSSYTEHWRVWVDVNQNEVYEVSELLFSGSSRGTLSGDITLPEGAFSGDTGMRVSMRYSRPAEACGSFTYGEVEDYLVSMALDNEPPTITTVEPQPNQSSAPLNSSIMVTFNEPLSPNIDLSNAFNMFEGAVEVEGDASVTGQSITFVPNVELSSGTVYKVEVSTLVTDLVGNPLAAPYEWEFTTDDVQDTLAPQVETINPMRNERGVPINSSVSATFSEAIDASTLTASSFFVSANGVDVPGQFSSNGAVVLFEPSLPFDYATSYIATLSPNITDLAGNALEAEITWEFKTGVAPDTVAPELLSVTPEDLATNVNVNSVVVANFSEAMNAASLTPVSFSLSDGVDVVQASVSTDNSVATLSPAEPLSLGTAYFANITTEATDLAGNALDTAISWQFSTEPGFTVSGAVSIDGSGLSNVKMTLSGDADATVTTDVNGEYSFTNLVPGSYFITPSLTGYEFDSINQSADIVDADLSELTFNASAVTVLNVPSEYSTIQSALESAVDGATILVDDGVYTENLVVDKPVTIESINGYLSTSVVSSTGGNVFLVNSPDVTIKGFDIYGATNFSRAGVYFNEGAHNGKALDNRCGYDNIHRNHSGIRIFKSDNIEISGTICQVQGLYGIRAEFTNGSKITNNLVEQQSFDGISLADSDNNEISGNTVNANRTGVSLRQSDDNMIEGNSCSDNENHGIWVDQGNSNSLTSNECADNGEVGIYLTKSNDSIVATNQASSNDISGIVVFESDQVVVEQNICSSNSAYGLYLNTSDLATVTQNVCNFNGSRGLRLRSANQNSIVNNQFNFQRHGVEFGHSNDNMFVANTVKSQITGIKGCELIMMSSSNNTLFQNSFISYTVEDVCSNNGSSNIWNSPSNVSYIYNEAQHSAVIGNYYSFASITDADSDGVSDIPLSLPGDEPDDASALASPIDEYLFD